LDYLGNPSNPANPIQKQIKKKLQSQNINHPNFKNKIDKNKFEKKSKQNLKKKSKTL
jgi:hypothetical protein